MGLSAVAYGFGDVRRGAKIWLYELSCALAFYPAFRFFAAGAQLFKRNTGTTLFLWHIFYIVAILHLFILGIKRHSQGTICSSRGRYAHHVNLTSVTFLFLIISVIIAMIFDSD